MSEIYTAVQFKGRVRMLRDASFEDGMNEEDAPCEEVNNREAALLAHDAALRALAATLAAALRATQHVAFDGDDPSCPRCEIYAPLHTPECSIGAALRAAEEAGV